MAVRRRPVLAEFVDRFGEQQVVHRHSGGKLAIRRKGPTVALALSKTVGKFVGDRIHEERTKADMTMAALAERAGLRGGKQAIYSMEQAIDVGVRLGTLYGIAAALNVSPFSLLPPVAVALEQAGVQMQNGEKLAV